MTDPLPSPRRTAWRWWLALGILVALAGGSALGIYWVNQPTPASSTAEPGPPEPPSVANLTPDPAIRNAIEKARAVVLESPDSASAWGKFGMVLSAHSFYAEALVALAEAERLDDRDPRWLYYQAMLLRQIDQKRAVAKWRRAVNLGSDVPDILRLRLAEDLLQLDQFTPAEEQLQALLRKDEKDGRAALLLARAAFRREWSRGALPHLFVAQKDPRTRKAATLLLAEVHHRMGKPSLAGEANRQAAALPDDAPWPDPYAEALAEQETGKQTLVGKAGRLLLTGRADQAVDLLREAVEHYPEMAYAWLMLGKAYLTVQTPGSAERALRKAVTLEPGSVEAQFLLGMALLLQGKRPDALASFRQAAKVKPESAQTHYMIGHCLAEQNDDAGAIAAYREAIRCKLELADAHRDLAEVLARAGRPAEALEHARNAAKLAPGDAKAAGLLERLQKK